MNVSNYKAVVYGDPKSGKKSLIKQLTNDKGQLVVEDKTVKAQYIFEFEINNFEPDEDTVCLIYVIDLTNADQLKNIESKYFSKINKDSIPQKNISILVGNKVDLESDRQVDKEEMQDYAIDLGMLVNEVSCINNCSNIEALIKQISNKAKLILKNQKKRVPAGNSKSPRTFRENIMINNRNFDKSQELDTLEINQTQKPSQVNTQNSSITIIKPKDIVDVRKEQKDQEKNRISNGDIESSSSPSRKKFDFKDRLKQFSKKKDNEDFEDAADHIVENKKEPTISQKEILDVKQGLKKTETISNNKPNNIVKHQELNSTNNNKNEFLSKFQKITQKNDSAQVQDVNAQKNDTNPIVQRDRQASFKGQESKISNQIKKFEQVEQNQKQDLKSQPIKSSIVKRNSITQNSEQSAQMSNSRNSISQKGKSSTTENESKNIASNNNKAYESKTNNYHSKEEDKKSIQPAQSNASQRSEQSNSNGGQSLIESMYKNRIGNKIPPSITNGKHEVKNVVKFQDEVIVENKRKQSDITGSRNLVKDSILTKPNNSTQDDLSKKKISPLELLKMKPDNNINKNNSKDSRASNERKESENLVQQEQKNQNYKNVENNQKALEKEESKEEKSTQQIIQKNQNNSFEMNSISNNRKISFQNTKPSQKIELPISNTEQKQKQVLDNLEEGDNQGRPLPKPQINILQCSSSPKSKQENTQIGGIGDQSTAKKSQNNSLNEYLENENLVNNQLSLLNELANQSQQAQINQTNSQFISKTESQLCLQNNEFKLPVNQDLKQKNQQDLKQQIPNEVKQQDTSSLQQLQPQQQNPFQFKSKENQLIVSEYSDKEVQDNQKTKNQINEGQILNLFDHLKIFESNVINQDNPPFYRASFENVPNIMNPSSNESSMILPQVDGEGQSQIKPKQGSIQNEKQTTGFQADKNAVQQQPFYDIKQIIENRKQTVAETNSFDTNFNSFNIKENNQQFQNSNNQAYSQKFNQFRQNIFNQQENSNSQNQSQNLEQFQSFNNKPDTIQEIKQQNQQLNNNLSISNQNQISQIKQANETQKENQIKPSVLNNSPPQILQQNSHQTIQKDIEGVQNTSPLSQIQLQQMNQQQQHLLQNSFKNNQNFQTNQQINQFSQINPNNLNQSPPQQFFQNNENLLGQFGSQGTTVNHSSLSQGVGNLSFQQQQSDQDILMQQLLKQLLVNQQFQSNQLTMQLIQQLLQNQQINQNFSVNSNGFQSNIPPQFSFAQNPNNIQQLSPYIQQTQRQQSQQTIVSSPYTNPFDNQIQINQSSLNELQQRQSILSQNNQIQLSPLNKFSPNQPYSLINLQKADEIIDQTQTENYRNNIRNLNPQNEKNKEEQANLSKYNNQSELDGKVSRFSIHTNNVTPEPNNLSGIGQHFYDHNFQNRDNSLMVADIEMKQNNFNKSSPYSLSRPNGDIYFQPFHQSDEIQNDFLNNQDHQHNQFFNERDLTQQRDIQNGESRGRNMNQNYYYQQQSKGLPSDRYHSHLRQDEVTDRSNLRRDISEGNQRQNYQLQQGNRYQVREFSNSSHIDELLREVNNISLNKSQLKDKYHGSSVSQSQIRSSRNYYVDNLQNNTSNILLNTTGNLVDKSIEQVQELSKLDKNIKALEESIEDIDYELLQGRIQQKIKSRREHSNNQDVIREKDTNALSLEMKEQISPNPSLNQRLKSQKDRVSYVDKQQNLQMQNIIQSIINQEDDSYRQNNVLKQRQITSNSNIPIYETKLQTSRKSPQKLQQNEDNQILSSKSISRKSIQQNTQRTHRNVSQEANAQTSLQTQYLHQQNFCSKKQKSILLLNFEFNNQQFIIDVFGDDTSFQLAEKFFSSSNKTATRNQIKKLANIIESVVNKYCQNLYDKIQKVEKKSQNIQFSKS